MAILINDNYSLSACKPFDARYLNICTPWTDVPEVLAAIPTYRYIGLTVNIAGVEYWWKDGVGDGDLVIKTAGAGTGTLTGATNGLSLVNSGTTVILGGALSESTMILNPSYTYCVSGSSAGTSVSTYCEMSPTLSGWTKLCQTSRAITLYGYDCISGGESMIEINPDTLITCIKASYSGQIHIGGISSTTCLTSDIICSDSSICNSITAADGIFLAVGGSQVEVIPSMVQLISLNDQLDMTTGGTTFTSGNDSEGIKYFTDYSATFVDRSLVDKAYVDNLVDASGVTASNGLTAVGNDVQLGGTLSDDVNINTTTGYTLSIGDASLNRAVITVSPTDYLVGLGTQNKNFDFLTECGSDYAFLDLSLNIVEFGGADDEFSTYAEISPTSICFEAYANTPNICTVLSITPSAITVTGEYSGFAGIEYVADYSANYTNRSLVDKEYVDGLTTTACNGLTNVGGTIVLGGPLTGDTLVDISSGTMYFSGDTGNVVLQRGGTSSNYYGGLAIENGDYKLYRQYGASKYSHIWASSQNINMCSQGGAIHIEANGAGSAGRVQIYGNTCVCIGGYSTGQTAIVGTVCLETTPVSGSETSDGVLVWNSVDKQIKQISPTSLGEDNNDYSKTIVTGSTTLTTGSSYVILVNHTAPITITLPATPFDGQAFKIKDASNNALTNNITIARNGNNIDRQASNAVINTDSGVLELVYDSTLGWFTLAFVN